jgi:hypothetical protein
VKHPTIGRDPDGINVPQGEKDANENKGGEADDGTNVPPGLAKGDGGDRQGAQGAFHA